MNDLDYGLPSGDHVGTVIQGSIDLINGVESYSTRYTAGVLVACGVLVSRQIEGNESFFSTVGDGVKKVIQYIKDTLKRIWNFFFGDNDKAAKLSKMDKEVDNAIKTANNNLASALNKNTDALNKQFEKMASDINDGNPSFDDAINNIITKLEKGESIKPDVSKKEVETVVEEIFVHKVFTKLKKKDTSKPRELLHKLKAVDKELEDLVAQGDDKQKYYESAQDNVNTKYVLNAFESGLDLIDDIAKRGNTNRKTKDFRGRVQTVRTKIEVEYVTLGDLVKRNSKLIAKLEEELGKEIKDSKKRWKFNDTLNRLKVETEYATKYLTIFNNMLDYLLSIVNMMISATKEIPGSK